MKVKILAAVLVLVCLFNFENTALAQEEKNDASFKEAIDFVFRYSMKTQERDSEQTNFLELSIVDESTFTVQQVLEVKNTESSSVQTITNEFSMRDISTVTIEKKRKTYIVSIGCRIEDCVVHKYTTARRGKLENFSGRISEISFVTEEEATANRIKKALEHAINLMPEEKF